MQKAAGKSDQLNLSDLAIYASFKKSPYASIKIDSYFFTYEDLFAKYRGKPVTFVEVGILSGGSLFMWRDYLGPEARIIGVEFNPGALKWQEHGFEIFIGDQSDPAFWQSFFKEVGPVDILLDDGGHTNEQQIVTCMECIPNISDGGKMIVEDTHTSYFRDYGNPSNRSFISFAKHIVDGVNGRYPRVPASKNPLMNHVSEVRFFDSIVSFEINRNRCFNSSLVKNEGKTDNPKDFRHAASWFQRISDFRNFLLKYTPLIHRVPIMKTFLEKIFRAIFFVIYWLKSRRLGKYWK